VERRHICLLHGILEAAAQGVPLRLQDALGQSGRSLRWSALSPAFPVPEQPGEDGEAAQVSDLLVGEELAATPWSATRSPCHHVVELLEILRAGVAGVVEGVADDDPPRPRSVEEVVVREPGPVADVAEDEVHLTTGAPPDELVPGALMSWLPSSPPRLSLTISLSSCAGDPRCLALARSTIDS
jgi:hypothetical protein